MSHGLWYNDYMNKVAYHFNKKKTPAKTEGKFLYYYPCNSEYGANTVLSGMPFYVVEVTEKEWEALFELDRFEYNNWHKYYRHNEPFPENEEELSPTHQERYLDTATSYETFAIEKLDKARALATLTPKERQIYQLSIDEQYKQTEIAKMLGITQGAVSATFNRARQKMDAYDYSNENTPDEIVWKFWEMFIRDNELPYFLDVEIEFVIRQLLGDIIPFVNWFYSIGELCRYIMRYYLFEEENIEKDIAEYLSKSTQDEQQHFKDHYGDKLPIVQGVYVRLCIEIRRRQLNNMHDSDKAFIGIYSIFEKVAKRLNLSVKDCFTQRFYPYFAKMRNKRLTEFYKHYTGKKLPQ